MQELVWSYQLGLTGNWIYDWFIVGINGNHCLHCWLGLWSSHLMCSCSCLLLCCPCPAVWRPGAANPGSGTRVCRHEEASSEAASVQRWWSSEKPLSDCRLPAKFCASQGLPGTLGRVCHASALLGLDRRLGVTARSRAACEGSLSCQGFGAVPLFGVDVENGAHCFWVNCQMPVREKDPDWLQDILFLEGLF